MNRFLSLLSKIKSKLHYFYVIAFVFTLTFFIKLYPLQRFHNWDHLWHDGIIVSKLHYILDNLSFLKLPVLDTRSNFGSNILAEPQHSESFISFFNVFLFFGIEPEIIILIRRLTLLSLLSIGIALYIREITNNKRIAIVSSLFSVSIYYVWGISSHTTYIAHFCLAPMIFYIITKLRQNSVNPIHFVQLYFLFFLFTSNIPNLVNIFILIIGYQLLDFLFYFKDFHRVKMNSKIILVLITANLHLIVPFLYNSFESRYLNALNLSINDQTISVNYYYSLLFNNALSSLVTPL